jgi:hypothetical protein
MRNDDALMRRFAMPILHKRCIKHIKAVLRQLEFERAVAKAVQKATGQTS